MSTQATASALATTAPVINEFVFSHADDDDYEYIEIFGDPDTDYSAYTLIVVEGDGSGAGTIDDVFALDSTDADGFQLFGYFSDELENGTQTVLLVEGFTGAVGDDIDTDNDGIIDSAPWTSSVDEVAVSDGGSGDAVYSDVVLAGGFDGISYTPGGASRIPNGTDTDSTADWVRNDFDRAGIDGETGTPTPGEAYNTPGAVNAIVEDSDPEVTLIHDVQGSDETSPMEGDLVTVEAVVVGDFQDGDTDTGRSLGGFYLQEEDGDADSDPTTSEGIFVYDGSSPGVDVNVGDLVRVTGTVQEYYGETQISSVTSVVVLDTEQELPTAATITLPAMDTTLSQDGDAQPDLEAFEGMLVTFPDTLTITEMYQLDRFNEIKLSQGGRLEQFTQSNSPDSAAYEAQLQEDGARTITYDDGLNEQNAPIGNLDGFGPTFSTATDIRMGDTIDNLSGVLSYQWAGNSASGSTWRVRSTEDGENTFDKVNERPADAPDVDGTLTVASFNVLNYFTTLDDGSTTANGSGPRGADSSDEFLRQTEKLITAVLALDADILGLVELENDFLAGSSGNAIEYLVDELNAAADSEIYDWVYPGSQFVGTDAISTGFIYNVNTVAQVGEVAVLEFEEASAAATFALADVLNDVASSDDQVGDFARNRPAVAATFADTDGEEVTVVVNHFKSKGDSNLEDVVLDAQEHVDGGGTDITQADIDALLADPNYDAGEGAGFWNAVRADAAAELAEWIATNPTGVSDGDALIIGDLNSYAKEDPIFVLEDAGYTDLVQEFVGSDAYSYVFDGQTGTLDYGLANDSLLSQVTGAAEWHINADEPDAIDYNLDFGRDPDIFDGTDPVRSSDHDPVVVGLDLETAEEASFTLELLHFSDQEAGAAAVVDIPNFSAVLNALRAQDLGDDGVADNTLTLSSGDAFIPGLFFDASEAAFGSGGIADIQIQNELGVQVMSFGNHEFDFGTEVLAGLIDGSAPGTILGEDFGGTDYPYLSANLDFSTDANMAPLEVAGAGVAGGGTPEGNTVTSSVVVDVNGENIGVVGATTPALGSISSPGTVGISPSPFDTPPTEEELQALADEIQLEVDALLEQNPDINKVILLAHMQQISVEFDLAPLLSNVDIIVAGGSDTRLFDDNDVPYGDDTAQGEYPTFLTDVAGNPVAVVNTDGNYKYVGRLVIDFDEDGVIIPESYDSDISGAYATDDQGVEALDAAGLIDPEIQQIVDAIETEIVATEGNVFGVSDVFLNGNRSGVDTPTDPDGVRTQETNLGDLTADANLAIAEEITGEDIAISLKNGGGIRDSIGQIIVPSGGSEAVRLPNELVLDGDGNVVKPEGGISQNDIQSTLAFNNSLTALTLTKQEIVDLLEHGVSALPEVAGQFPQVSGVKFSFDPDLPAGDRIQSAGIFDPDTGELVAELVRDGEISGDPDETFRIVTLNFLAESRFDDDGNFIGGGDGYPFPNLNLDPDVGEVADPDVVARINRVDLVDEDVQTGDATFADDGTEQDALAEYLLDNFSTETDAYDQADTGRDLDERIQNLNYREDDVLPDDDDGSTEEIAGTGGSDRIAGTDANSTIDGLAGNDRIDAGGGDNVVDGGTGNDRIESGDGDDMIVGGAGNDRINAGDGNNEIYGDAGNDRIESGEGDDIIIGGAGKDTIRSGAGNDTIDGGAGNDRIYAGAGDDLMIGGAGNDRMYGEAGIDTADYSDFLLSELEISGSSSNLRVAGDGIGIDRLIDVEVLVVADGMGGGVEVSVDALFV